MSRNTRVYLNDIISSINQIRDYVKTLSFDDFSEDKRTIDAVIRNLEIIGEAVKNIPQDIKSEFKYEWRAVAGLRDILIHEYFSIDEEIIWDIIKNKIPELYTAVEEMMRELQIE